MSLSSISPDPQSNHSTNDFEFDSESEFVSHSSSHSHLPSNNLNILDNRRRERVLLPKPTTTNKTTNSRNRDGNGNGNGGSRNVLNVLELASPINQYYLGKLSNDQHIVSFPEVMNNIIKSKNSNSNQINSPFSIDSNDSSSLQLQIPESPLSPASQAQQLKTLLSFVIGTDINLNDNNHKSHTHQHQLSSSNSHSHTHSSNNVNVVDDENYNYLWGLKYKYPYEIYEQVNDPFSYTPGFHGLFEYLKSRFNRNYLVDMAKSMAQYRPSFIACTNTLKEEDLIFMEQCFQRTLLEYQRFISISGTPTIIWRRTGQISFVGKEFLILTGWKEINLLNKITFIVELMDDDSVLEYFRLFSKISFGDFRGATMSDCTLLTPNKGKIKTSSIWTLKRDVFGIPMMIIGNFLPILD